MIMNFGKWPTIWHRDTPPIYAVISIEISGTQCMEVCVYRAEHIDNSLMIDCKSYLDLYDK